MTTTIKNLVFRKNAGFDPRDAHYEALHPRTSNVLYDVQKLQESGRWSARVLRYRHSGDDYSIDDKYLNPVGYRTMRDARAACQLHAQIVVG